MFDDPFRIKEACDAAALSISGLQSHGPLGRPDVHGEYIKLAIRTAAEIGVPVVNTDEGIKAKWTSEEDDFVLIKYTLREAAFVAERRGVKIGLEPHAQYSKTPDGLDRIYDLVDSDADTGRLYLHVLHAEKAPDIVVILAHYVAWVVVTAIICWLTGVI